ncbi:hypothetical protein [Tsukamurella sp. NPDC003166]|uniref:hypothetical protein n=1 Tax=Tsukamurella sp. NPDC003166 TaxID=3154444 RepID=UPI0033B561D0
MASEPDFLSSRAQVSGFDWVERSMVRHDQVSAPGEGGEADQVSVELAYETSPAGAETRFAWLACKVVADDETARVVVRVRVRFVFPVEVLDEHVRDPHMVARLLADHAVDYVLGFARTGLADELQRAKRPVLLMPLTVSSEIKSHISADPAGWLAGALTHRA